MYLTAYTDLRSLHKRDIDYDEIYYFIYVKNKAV